MNNPVPKFSSTRKSYPGDRLYDSLNTLLIILSAISHASSLMKNADTHKTEKPVGRTNTQWADLAFVLPMRGPLELALDGTKPQYIKIGIVTDPDEAGKPLTDVKVRTEGLKDVFAHIIAPVFLSFFERYNDWGKER